MARTVRYVLTLAMLAGSVFAAEREKTILVAATDTTAGAAAIKLADGKQVFAVSSLFTAFDLAAQMFGKCESCKVTIKVAGGPEVGLGGVGRWELPAVTAPLGRLHILGGWDEKFAERSPVNNPTVLVISEERSGAVMSFEETVLAELVFSGFALDAAPGNRYDTETSSVLLGSSDRSVLMVFRYLTTKHLVIADNVFMNAANGVSAPLIRPADEKSDVIIRNNVFLNNVFCWRAIAPGHKNMLARYVFQGNSFILNFPRNPDPATSNPAALEIGNKSTAAVVEITGNLFAYNIGGAIFPQSDPAYGPQMVIRDNLFWQNSTLFGGGDDKGAVVGKFNRSAVYLSLTPEEAAVAWTMKGNVVVDPNLTGDYATVSTDKTFVPHMRFNLENLPHSEGAAIGKYGASADRVK